MLTFQFDSLLEVSNVLNEKLVDADHGGDKYKQNISVDGFHILDKKKL